VPWVHFGAGDGRGPSAHVAVLGACEGEALLYARWVREHRARLEAVLGVSIRSMSWLASDPLAVGHFPLGSLSLRAVEADVWIVVATDFNLDGGYTAGIIIESLAAADTEYVEVRLLQDGARALRFSPSVAARPPEDLLELEPGHPALKTHPGGLFKLQALQLLGVRP